jgi:hypothetical protein
MEDLKAGFDLTPFYGLIGAVVVAQFSAILGLFGVVFKAGVYKGRNDLMQDLMMKDINAAHQKLRANGLKPIADCDDNDSTKE